MLKNYLSIATMRKTNSYNMRKKKVGFAAVFTDITKRGTLPKKTSIHTAKMTAKKIAL